MSLSDDTKKAIQGLRDQIDWKKVTKGSDKDKVIDAFVKKVVASCEEAEKKEAEPFARKEAEAACMNATVDEATATATKELENYMKESAISESMEFERFMAMKAKRVREAEDNMAASLSGVPEIVNETPEVNTATSVTGMNGNIMGDYGENNQYIADPTDETGILSDSSLDNMSDEEIADTVNREYMQTPMVVTGGVQSDNIAEPAEPTAPAEPTDDEILADISDEDLNAEVDADLDDVDLSGILTPEEEETFYSIFNKIADAAASGDFASKIEKETGVSPEEAEKIAASTEAATIATVKAQNPGNDLGSDIDAAINEDPETPPADMISLNYDAQTEDSGNDEIDQSIENAIDDYEAQGDYSDEDLYEALCYKFDITNSKQLLAENNGCVPDAILGISRILHERLA